MYAKPHGKEIWVMLMEKAGSSFCSMATHTPFRPSPSSAAAMQRLRLGKQEMARVEQKVIQLDSYAAQSNRIRMHRLESLSGQSLP